MASATLITKDKGNTPKKENCRTIILHKYRWNVIVQSPSCVQLATPWTASHQTSLLPTISWNLSEFMSPALARPSKHLIWHPLLLLPSIFPSSRDFSNKLAFPIRWSKYWSFRFSISPCNEYSGLISFNIDWFDLLAVQGTQEFSPAPQLKGINSKELMAIFNLPLRQSLLNKEVAFTERIVKPNFTIAYLENRLFSEAFRLSDNNLIHDQSGQPWIHLYTHSSLLFFKQQPSWIFKSWKL